MAGYCEVSDLLLSGALGLTTDAQKFIDQAADEIHTYLGPRYKVPLVAKTEVPWSSAIDPWELLLLKTINIKLATGRLILQKFAAAEEDTQHAYGAALVKEARHDLMQIANGAIDLHSVQLKDPVPGQQEAAPGITVHDDVSLVDVWEDRVMRGQFCAWGQPGAMP